VTAPAVARPWSPSTADLRRAVASFVRARAGGVRRAAPLGAVLLTTLVVQVAVAPHVAVRGAAPDVLLVGVTAVAAGRGPRAGAAFGFGAGLGADLFLTTPLGTSALAFTLVGQALGRSLPARSSGLAAALCSPASTCFACRTGRQHTAAVLAAVEAAEPRASVRPLTAAPPDRRRRRVAARRASVRRILLLTGAGVGTGRLATAAVATAFGGVPFPGVPGLLRVFAVAAVSAPLGPPVLAIVRRLPTIDSGMGRR
jgi:rod shape-determining protein MreD